MRLLLALLVLLASVAHAAPLPGRALYLPMVVRAAAAAGLPPEIADAVAMVETGYAPGAVGSAGEVGLMQVMPATAAQLGFRGSLAELADPATNIRFGVTYLARAWAAGGEDICRALTKYRAGLGQEAATPLSARYCARAIAWLAGGEGRLPAGVDAGSGAPQPDPHVIAILPPLPEQMGLLPTFVQPAVAVTSLPAAWQVAPAKAAVGLVGTPGRFSRYLPQVQAGIAQLAAEP